ncbi:hypothetical protein N752_19710 [Desulforamulus aquiferis]|nr:hypothetical protein [Desulforamulus aquiferis]RYD03407.1 hypothetical protein N752_19710 [Desulforamulus aquiferis]
MTTTKGEVVEIDNPSNLPPVNNIEMIEEPFVKATIMVPKDFVGTVMELCQGKRGVYSNMEYMGVNRVMLTYEIPLSEIIFDFFDQLKSRTKGYASLDYELTGYRQSDLVKMDILLNGEPLDALSCIIHKERAKPGAGLLWRGFVP